MGVLESASTVQWHAGPPDEPDRYALIEAVAAGAEGVVYRGELRLADRRVAVAVKMLNPGHYSDLDRWAQRWLAQAELMSRVIAPGVVAVRDAFIGPLPHASGSADSSSRSLFLIMDWVEGEPLGQWAARHPDASAEVLLLPLLPVAAALDLMHSGSAPDAPGVVHRDVKLGNILMTSSGHTVLVDVGGVRELRGDRGTGIGGTSGYIAPEVLDRGEWGPPADRFALGCVAVALLTGVEPPIGASVATLRDVLEGAAPCAGRPELVEHVLTMLHPDPTSRPQQLANWVAQLRRSSLVVLPEGQRVAPRAPGRHPDQSGAVNEQWTRFVPRLAATRGTIVFWSAMAILAVSLGTLAVSVSGLNDLSEAPQTTRSALALGASVAVLALTRSAAPRGLAAKLGAVLAACAVAIATFSSAFVADTGVDDAIPRLEAQLEGQAQRVALAGISALQSVDSLASAFGASPQLNLLRSVATDPGAAKDVRDTLIARTEQTLQRDPRFALVMVLAADGRIVMAVPSNPAGLAPDPALTTLVSGSSVVFERP